MKNSSIKFFLLLVLGVFIISSCHKNRPNPIPGPAPIFDSTAYKDSVAHAQHIQDSIQHYNDSLVHYQDSLRVADSTFRFYFNRIRGTYVWSDTAYSYHPLNGHAVVSYPDTTLTIDYKNGDTTHLSVKIGNTVFPQGELRTDIFADRVVFSSVIVAIHDTLFTLTHYFPSDSLKYEYEYFTGPLSNTNKVFLTHR